MDNLFGIWLLEELEKRGMSQADLSRSSGITTAQMSRIISGTRGAGKKTLTAIAHALRLPPDLVFEKAGILPPTTELTLLQRSIMGLVKNLPDNDLQMFYTMLRTYTDEKQTSPKTAK